MCPTRNESNELGMGLAFAFLLMGSTVCLCLLAGFLLIYR